eukprot:gnl/TRDRNA2_/TRDRNA2_81682_c0_seq1.p1 gnl/TRDRNA2_/TRDRNA2_81682_c0~~gnl/TRDRNA2_/TRDRNA2_81682_c0_seq1.p1  ORF type:complete len:460 (-),score=88.38 gnl/TRDRNA2_/TRDRNA2_81682_c0_seq1:61-1440(-)
MAEPQDRLTQAVALEKKGREFEQQGSYEAALREFINSSEVFKYLYKWESNPRIKEMVRGRLEEVVSHAEKLREQMKNGTLPHPQQVAPGPSPAAATGLLPPPGQSPPPASGGGAAPGGSGAADGTSADDQERERMRKGLEASIMTEKPDVKWDDVAGLKVAKESLQETVILPTKFPQLFQGKREPWHGILLYGPPGTGKSFLAKACATEAESMFFSLSSSDLVSKWMGESEKLVRNLFEMAREQSSIIFIDEVDSLCGARGESGESDAARRIKTEFLVQMEGVRKTKAKVLVLGATNTPWDLDMAIRRRFEKRIYIPLPDLQGRLRLLDLALGDTRHQCSREDLAWIAEKCEGFSGADMSVLVRDAIYEPVRRCQRARTFQRVARQNPDGTYQEFWTPCSPGATGAVEMTLMQVKPSELLEPDVLMIDFEGALERVRPSVGKEQLSQHEDWTSRYGMEG